MRQHQTRHICEYAVELAVRNEPPLLRFAANLVWNARKRPGLPKPSWRGVLAEAKALLHDAVAEMTLKAMETGEILPAEAPAGETNATNATNVCRWVCGIMIYLNRGKRRTEASAHRRLAIKSNLVVGGVRPEVQRALL